MVGGRQDRYQESNRKADLKMEHSNPKANCCGVPIVWLRCGYWEDEVWEGMCMWSKREFAYFDAKGGVTA